MDANEGDSLAGLALLEAAICSKFGVQLFEDLGHGPSMLQVWNLNLLAVCIAWICRIDSQKDKGMFCKE